MKKHRKKRGIDSLIIVSAAGPKEAFRARADLLFKNKLDKAVTAIENDYLSSASLSIEDISNKVLKESRRLTGSAFGFAGYIDPVTGFFIAVTHTREVWDKCSIRGKTITFKEFKGLWGWVLKNKKPLLTNKASADRRTCGTPKGHIKIDKFLAAPAVFNRKLAGMLALANPARDYTRRDLDAVKKLARTYAIILQRKFAEDKLRESEETHRAIINSSSDIIYTVDANGIVTYMSRRAEKYGYAPGDIVGRHVLEFAHPDDRPMLARALGSALKTGVTLPFLSYRVKKKDGSWFYAEQKSGIIMKDGRPHLITCVIRDVTESRQLQELLIQSEKKYRTLFDHAADGVLVMSADGKSLALNKSFAKMHGYDAPEEMAGLRLHELDAPETAKLAPERLRRMLAGETLSFEVEHYRRDGSVFPLQVTCNIVKIDGRPYFLGFHRDITARMDLENRLKENEDKYRTLFENANAAIIIADAGTGKILDVNRRAESLTGWLKSELIGMDRLKLHPPEEAAYYKKHFKEHISRGGVKLAEAVIVKKTGARLAVQINASVMKVGGRKIIQGIFEDITEPKRAAEALRDSERKIRALFDQTFQFIGMLTPDGILTEANRTAMQFAGIHGKDCIGRPFWDTPWWTHSAEMRDKLREAVARAAKGETVRFEATHPAADGSLHYIDFSLKPIKDETGKIIFLLPEGRDITERRRLEIELKENEALLSNIFDTAPDMIFFKGLDGRYIKVNKACAELFQMTPGEFEGKADSDLFSAKDAGNMSATDREIVRTGITLTVDDSRTIAGKEYFFSTIKSPLRDGEGRIAGVLGIVRDVTEQKRTEEELINARAVAKAGKITGDAAHDFNNILAIINGYAAMMLDSAGDKSPLKSAVLEIVKIVRKAAAITAKLQTYSAKPGDKK